ncbi:hypothetical protein IW261DRAFT_1595020, partial [Armillaria novae-zelandiae]
MVQLSIVTSPTKAEILEPKNAIYSSNLSAAYYELGDQAYHAICRSAKNMLTGESSPVLAIKLDLEENLSTINEDIIRFIYVYRCFSTRDTGLDYTRPQNRKNPLELGKLSGGLLSSLALLWGGVGNSRHVLSSIIGLHQAFTKLNAKKRKALNVHLTLNDLHPRALARDLDSLCLLIARRKLRESLLKRLRESPSDLPAWIYVTQETIPGIIDALKYWDTKTSQMNTKDSSLMVPAWHQTFSTPTNGKRLKNFVDVGLSEEQVFDMASKFMLQPIPREPRRRKKCLANLSRDRDTIVLIELWGHVHRRGKKDKTRASDSSVDKVRHHIETTWKRNASLFDPSQEPHRSIIAIEYPGSNRCPFRVVSLIEPFNGRTRLVKGRNMNARSNQDCPAYSVISVFFDAVIDALIALKGRILLELIHDISAALVKMRIALDVSRPPYFPRKCSRGQWLSNVPFCLRIDEYHRLHYAKLEVRILCRVSFQLRFNSGVWQNSDHCAQVQCVQYYTLLSVKDYAHFFGCRVLTMDPACGNMEVTPEPLPHPQSTLPSREAPTTRLTHVLLATTFPPAFAHATSALYFAQCHDEIGIFKAPFNELLMFNHATSMCMTPRFEPVLSLVFLQTGSGVRGSCERGAVATSRGGHREVEDVE